MHSELLTQLQAAQKELVPQVKALRSATTALKKAIKLASEQKAEALAMQNILMKLQQAAQEVASESLRSAIDSFALETQKALDALAFEFARDLKNTFEQRGQEVKGRPPILTVGLLVLQIDMAARKAQWLYGKEALTQQLPLSKSSILKAYERQRKTIIERQIDVEAFLTGLHETWQQLISQRERRPASGRLNIIEIYGQFVMNRQPRRFWNAPSRQTFKEYPREHFVRDLVLAHTAPTVTIAGNPHRLRLGVATKSHASNPNRSIWLPESALEGQYYSDLTFEEL